MSERVLKTSRMRRLGGPLKGCQEMKKKIFSQGIDVIKHRKVQWVGFIVVNEMGGIVKSVAEFRILGETDLNRK